MYIFACKYWYCIYKYLALIHTCLANFICCYKKECVNLILKCIYTVLYNDNHVIM